MWPIAAIVGAAVMGAAALLVAGVSLAVFFERRRHRKLMHQHGLDSVSYHRSTLSPTEINYAHIPRPEVFVQRRGRPAQIPAIWNPDPPEDSFELEPPREQPANEDPILPTAKRRKAIRSSLNGSPFNTKTRRQKKIDKTYSLKEVQQSPLSAITEFTDSNNEEPALVELPTEITPKATPDRVPGSPPQLHVGKTRPAKPSREIFRAETSFTRSVSMASTMTVPAEPLPPLPTFDIYKTTKPDTSWRASITSLDTVGSSVLGAVFSSPSHTATGPTISSTEIQSFDFGFEESRSARMGLPPGRQAMQGICSGKPGINSITPSVENYSGRVVSLESAPGRNRATTSNDLKTIDASKWNGFTFHSQPRSNQTRHSMQDYGSILGKRGSFDDFSTTSALLIRRPASVASGNPYQWDLKPSFSMNRLSTGSNETKKGHKRQNCVRITNLSIPEKRNSRLGQMPELREEQIESPSGTEVKIPGLTLLEASQPVLRARASLVDVKGSPSPLQNRPVLVPTRPKRPIHFQPSSSHASLITSDSEVFSTDQPDPKTPETLILSNRQWSVSLTPTNDHRLSTRSQAPYESPTLPSPINAARFFPRRSLVKGPRNPPPSTIYRNGSPIPVGLIKQPVQKRVGPEELRKSIMALRSMNSEGRLLDASSHAYRNFSDDGNNSLPNAVQSLNSPANNYINDAVKQPYPASRRYGSVSFANPSKMRMTISPSGMSLGGTSIWEDASVRGDSPEPEMPIISSPAPSPVLVENGRQSQRMSQQRTPKLMIGEYDPDACENMVMGGNAAMKIWKGREQSPENLRVTEKHRFTVTPQGKGLGLRMGNAILGTPGSLYDRDGFLKE